VNFTFCSMQVYDYVFVGSKCVSVSVWVGVLQYRWGDFCFLLFHAYVSPLHMWLYICTRMLGEMGQCACACICNLGFFVPGVQIF
jgi:hypothetical protein